jgi:hypothetical protein
MIERLDARSILVRCNARGSFHALPSSTVDALLTEADRVKYRRPKNANGSRGRYFHAYLQRRAKWEDLPG